MPASTVVICIDGFDPEYLDACETPNLRELARKRSLKTGRSIMPSATDVNNVSLITASYAETHGISSNYRLVRETGEEIYMESSEYILTEIMFQRAKRTGKTFLVLLAMADERIFGAFFMKGWALPSGPTYPYAKEHCRSPSNRFRRVSLSSLVIVHSSSFVSYTRIGISAKKRK